MADAARARNSDGFIKVQEHERLCWRRVRAAIVLTVLFQAVAIATFALLVGGKDQDRVPVAAKSDAEIPEARR